MAGREQVAHGPDAAGELGNRNIGADHKTGHSGQDAEERGGSGTGAEEQHNIHEQGSGGNAAQGGHPVGAQQAAHAQVQAALQLENHQARGQDHGGHQDGGQGGSGEVSQHDLAPAHRGCQDILVHPAFPVRRHGTQAAEGNGDRGGADDAHQELDVCEHLQVLIPDQFPDHRHGGQRLVDRVHKGAPEEQQVQHKQDNGGQQGKQDRLPVLEIHQHVALCQSQIHLHTAISLPVRLRNTSSMVPLSTS